MMRTTPREHHGGGARTRVSSKASSAYPIPTMTSKIVIGLTLVVLASALRTSHGQPVGLVRDSLSSPSCRPEGERCMGEKGRPTVEWIPCCDGMECSGTSYSWGKFCQKPQPQCHKAGEKCIGAPGYNAIPWLNGCCGTMSCSKPADDWGLVCEDKCKAAGEKCMGAEGYPAVPWGSGCCNGMTCTKPAEDWGYVCEHAPPPQSGEENKCIAGFQLCDGFEPCCHEFHCTGSTKPGEYTATRCEPTKDYIFKYGWPNYYD